MFRLIVHEAVREEILALPAVVQAKQKTPSAEISLALKRQQEMLDEQENNRLG